MTFFLVINYVAKQNRSPKRKNQCLAQVMQEIVNADGKECNELWYYKYT